MFSDVALEARSEAELRRLGSLLPAVAGAWHGGGPASTRTLMSSSSMGFRTLQEHQRADAKLVKVGDSSSSSGLFSQNPQVGDAQSASCVGLRGRALLLGTVFCTPMISAGGNCPGSPKAVTLVPKWFKHTCCRKTLMVRTSKAGSLANKPSPLQSPHCTHRDPILLPACRLPSWHHEEEGSQELSAQLYRLLWIYVAVHELARDTPSKTHKRQWPREWREAAIRIAQGPTPLLVAGGELDTEQVEAGEPAAGGFECFRSHFLGT